MMIWCGMLFCALGIALGLGTWQMTRARKRLTRAQPGDSRMFSRTALWLLATVSLFSLADWLLLWALPSLGLSFARGIDILPPLAASAIIRLLVLLCIAAAKGVAQVRSLTRMKKGSAQAQPPNPASQGRISRPVIAFLGINLAFSLVQIDAYVLEPQWVQTTELSLSFDELDPDAPPVRVVHLTDVHIERYSYREETIVRQVNALKPDLILFTGDYLNLSHLQDPVSAGHWRQFVSQLKAPYGIYAVRGTVEPSPESMQWLVEGTNVTWLEQEAKTIDVRGQQVTLVGVACSHNRERDGTRLDQALADRPERAFTLLLYHSPDLVQEAADRGIDLYVSGHTHGGQLRLPFLGPVVTGSVYGREYVAGLFEVPSDSTAAGQAHNTWMYNSRGLGLEGSGMPRARLLCRPEIVSIDLRGR
jgi:predicted MPP superfamily phosphohydrolase